MNVDEPASPFLAGFVPCKAHGFVDGVSQFSGFKFLRAREGFVAGVGGGECLCGAGTVVSLFAAAAIAIMRTSGWWHC